MGGVNRSMAYNCTALPGTSVLHSIRTEKVTNIHSIHKRKYSFFCLRCIDNEESIDECQNETNKIS